MKCRFFIKTSVLLVLIFFLSIKLFAQDGFNKRYSSPLPSAVFYNLLTDVDTIILFGVGVDTQQVVTLVKLDTTGNLIQFQTFKDATGGQFYANLNYSIVLLSNGNYSFTGEVGDAQTTFWMETNKQFEIVGFQKYTDPSILVAFQKKLIEINNGFLIAGDKQKNDYTHDFSIISTDGFGDLIWEKKYGKPGVNNILRGMTQIQPNQFIVSGLHGNPQGTQLPNWWAQSWIFAIDSLGNKLWEFDGPVNDEIAAIGTQQTVDGNWIYGTGDFQLIGNNEWGSQTKIVCRDPQWNLLWQTNISPTVYSTNRIRDIVPAHDGNYIVIGEWTTPQISGSVNYRAGVVTKISPTGAILWSKEFSGYPTQIPGSRNLLGGVAVLPSGSIVAAGYSQRFHPTSVASQGWVIKISPDGCVVDTLCVITPTTEPLAENSQPLTVFPNPAQTQVTFALPPGSPPANAQLSVFDALGRKVWSFNGWIDPEGWVWTPQNLPAGVYFWRFDGEMRQSGSLVWAE